MSPRMTLYTVDSTCFPRMRGDEPPLYLRCYEHQSVFPACAGMSPFLE